MSDSTEKLTFGTRCLMAGAGMLARLPFGVLYLMSDVVYLCLRFLVRYRRKIIDRNLRNSFPELSAAERRKIKAKFYRNFADYIFETLKLLHISDAEMKRRMTFSGTEITDSFLAEGRDVVVYFSHCGNWEWAPSVSLWSRFTPGRGVEFCQIYRPLRSKAFDAIMLKLRGRFGSVSLPKRMAFLDLMRYHKRGIPTITGFMSDQKPSHGDPVHVVNFLNQPTAVITGTETAARRLNAAVVYWDMQKPSRGHYHINVKLITADIGALPEHAVTDRYISLLQQTIRHNPPIWLWSHNRWKNILNIPVGNMQA